MQYLLVFTFQNLISSIYIQNINNQPPIFIIIFHKKKKKNLLYITQFLEFYYSFICRYFVFLIDVKVKGLLLVTKSQHLSTWICTDPHLKNANYFFTCYSHSSIKRQYYATLVYFIINCYIK